MEQWETNWKDYYANLGVRMSAEPEVIKGAYNAMARKYHPDVNPSGAARMKEVNEAYEVLSDPWRKAQYDSCCRQKSCESSQGQAYRESPSSPGDNRQGILPWPSLTWQRVALFCSIPLGVGLIIAPLNLWFSIVGIFILVVACFASVKTRGLSKIGKGWTATKVSAGVCITSSLCVFGVAALALAVVFITGVAIISAIKALISL